jgi:hypothetical protein
MSPSTRDGTRSPAERHLDRLSWREWSVTLGLETSPSTCSHPQRQQLRIRATAHGMQHTVCSSAMVPNVKLTKWGGICQPTRQLKGSGHDRHDEAHTRHSSTGRVGCSGVKRGIVGGAPRSSDVLARTRSPRGGPGGGQSPGVEPHTVHRPGAAAGRRPDENEVEPSEDVALRHLRVGVASAERHPGQAPALPSRIAPYLMTRMAVIRIVPLNWEGDVQVTSPSHPGAPNGQWSIGVTRSGSTRLEWTQSDGRELENSLLRHRRVTFRVTLAPHHPPPRTRLDVGPTAPTGGAR